MKKFIIILLIVIAVFPILSVITSACEPYCFGWSRCISGTQHRWCFTYDPFDYWRETRECCTPRWQCESWGACIDGIKTRECWDGCGNTRTETQSCCIPSWTCGEWGNCIEGIQTRSCNDGCGHTRTENQVCEVPCIPSWQCDNWSECEEGTQSRVCNDGCGDTKTEYQECEMPLEPEPTTTEEPRQCQFPPRCHPGDTSAWLPDEINWCRMNTYISKYCLIGSDYHNETMCHRPNRAFSICWDWVGDYYQETWISQFGNYIEEKEWITRVGRYKFTWWKLMPLPHVGGGTSPYVVIVPTG